MTLLGIALASGIIEASTSCCARSSDLEQKDVGHCMGLVWSLLCIDNNYCENALRAVRVGIYQICKSG